MSTVNRYWSNDFRGHGSFGLNFNFGTNIVNRHSAVFAAICEVGFTGEPELVPWYGAADITIRNIVPKDDGTVAVSMLVNWDNDISLRIQFLVCND